jgi:predicted metalloprotease with PDZ domain
MITPNTVINTHPNNKSQHNTLQNYKSGPGALGDFSTSSHLIGELIGAMLDLEIRGATQGARSMDEVMRVMNTRFGGKGFTGRDVRTAVEEVCGCNTELFDRSVFNPGPIDFDRYLAAIGLRATLTWEPAVDQNRRPIRDLRIFAYNRSGEDTLRVNLGDPGSAWGKAGLHTNDVILEMNGQRPRSWPEFRAVLSAMAMGDTASVTVRQAGTQRVIKVPITGYDRPVVRMEPLPGASAAQKRLLEQWSGGR